MSSTRFRTNGIELELHGSEEFVLRQLRDLAFALGDVDSAALNGYTAPAARSAEPAEEPAPTSQESDAIRARSPGGATNGTMGSNGTSAPANGAELQASGSTAAQDALISFFHSVPPIDRDRQAHAALVFAYHLHREEGVREVRIGDLLKCCIRVGVDSRNFHRAIGVLTRRSLLAEVRRGSSYRITDQGMAAIEERLS
ncbi:MAG: hypothetical protein V3T86_12280 [Planctomycetota bacterium]